MLHILALDLLPKDHIPNLLPKAIGPYHMTWDRPAGRLLWATLIWFIAVNFVLYLCRKPKPAEPPTWAQAMLGAVASFALMLISYGTIPHEWLNYSNAYLHWNASKNLVGAGQSIIGPIHFLNFSINKQAVSDTGAVVIYVFMLTFNVILFSKWQKRPVRAPEEEPASTSAASAATEQPAGTSAYGRPVTVKS